METSQPWTSRTCQPGPRPSEWLSWSPLWLACETPFCPVASTTAPVLPHALSLQPSYHNRSDACARLSLAVSNMDMHPQQTLLHLVLLANDTELNVIWHAHLMNQMFLTTASELAFLWLIFHPSTQLAFWHCAHWALWNNRGSWNRERTWHPDQNISNGDPAKTLAVK